MTPFISYIVSFGVLQFLVATLLFTYRETATETAVMISEKNPKILLIRDFLSTSQCKHLIDLATPHLTPALVLDASTGQRRKSRSRTSSGCFLNISHDSVVHDIEERLSRVTNISKENGEHLHVLQYKEGQLFGTHEDHFSADMLNSGPVNGGQRVLTALMYLLCMTPRSNVKHGGETIFPRGSNASCSEAAAEEVVSITPRQGNLLLFWLTHPDGTPDEASSHAGCPVLEGQKWVATKWYRAHPIKIH